MSKPIHVAAFTVTADDVCDVLEEMLPPFKRYAADTPDQWDDQAVLVLETALATETTRSILGRLLGRDSDLPDDVLLAAYSVDMGDEVDKLQRAMLDELSSGSREPSGELRVMAATADVSVGTIIMFLPQAIAIAQALIKLFEARGKRRNG